MIHNEPPRYRAYMLRCWEVRSPDQNGPTTWRFGVEDPHTGQKQGFADLEALTAFLQAELLEESKSISGSDRSAGT